MSETQNRSEEWRDTVSMIEGGQASDRLGCLRP